jgi:hypothetical protein
VSKIVAPFRRQAPLPKISPSLVLGSWVCMLAVPQASTRGYTTPYTVLAHTDKAFLEINHEAGRLHRTVHRTCTYAGILSREPARTLTGRMPSAAVTSASFNPSLTWPPVGLALACSLVGEAWRSRLLSEREERGSEDEQVYASLALMSRLPSRSLSTAGRACQRIHREAVARFRAVLPLRRCWHQLSFALSLPLIGYSGPCCPCHGPVREGSD